MATDKQLIQEILLGKNETFGKLFRKYQRQVYSVCQGIVKNSHDAEELVQEVFVHAYLKLDQLDEPDKFLPWLKSIAKNRSRNYLHRKKETTIPLSQVSSTATRNTPDRLILKQELIDAVIEAIESLPQKDRELIRAHIDGLSHKDISERLGISIQASRDRLYRTRKRIKARVKDLLNAIIGLPKMLPLKKIISGGITAMKLGTSTKVTVGVIGAIVAGFIGFQVWLHQETQQPEVKPPKKITQQETTRTISQPKTVRPSSDDEESIQFEQYSDKEEVPNAKIPNKAKVPTAQNSDEEIRAFLAWLKSLDRQDSSDETEKDESNIEEKGIDYTREKELIESVIWGRWKKGYETQDVERYMSSIWEDDFFYTSDIGTPNDPSDDVIFRGGQQERESALTVFNQTENIELNLSPRSDIEFLSDTNAMVEYDYEIIFSNYYQPFPEVKLETISASGNMTFILERRENSEGIDEWKIIEWYDYAQK